jgi:hypothetical protein
MQQTLDQLNHVAAALFRRTFALADQGQLRGLAGTEIRSAAYASEQAQEEAVPSAQYPRAAIGEVEDHRFRNQSGLQGARRFSKFIVSPRI